MPQSSDVVHEAIGSTGTNGVLRERASFWQGRLWQPELQSWWQPLGWCQFVSGTQPHDRTILTALWRCACTDVTKASVLAQDSIP